MPEPMNAPISSRFNFSRSMPESSSALYPAHTANWENRSVRLSSFGEGKAAPGLKSLISAAIWQSKPEASNELILSMPQAPASRLDQNVSNCWPSG